MGEYRRYRATEEIEVQVLTATIVLDGCQRGRGVITGVAGDWLARDPANHDDAWIIYSADFAQHYELVADAVPETAKLLQFFQDYPRMADLSRLVCLAAAGKKEPWDGEAEHSYKMQKEVLGLELRFNNKQVEELRAVWEVRLEGLKAKGA